MSTVHDQSDVQAASGRVTELQTAQTSLVAQFRAWEQQWGPTVYSVLVDVHARWLHNEQRRTKRHLRRVA